MQAIEGARLIPGARVSDPVPAERSPGPAEGKLVRGKALIFWDPKVPGKKLDAIDTDQITPADDCVSESLDTLDARWKAGSFRYLVPNFRERVHRGETFVVAGDRFAIGSSREMSPAGLKGVADEAGREMVVVCGAAMGDIFRRNALNLGLTVVQSREAVEDAQEGDAFSFDPKTRKLSNETRGKTYEPAPLTPQEDEIRRSGGIIKIGRREFPESVRHPPAVTWPDAATARRLTSTEQIIWAHRVDKDAEVRPGATLRVYADLLPASDGTAPFSIHTFNEITGGDTIRPRQIAIANDHFVFNHREADDKQTGIGREFAERHGIASPYYATPGDGIFHFYFPEQKLVLPGALIPGADSHSRAYGAYGALGYGVGSTTPGIAWATGYVSFTVAKPFSPANAFPATEVARERLTFDKAFIGSCTNGGYGDLLEAALVLRAAREKGTSRAVREFVVFPGSGGVKRDIEKTDPRLGGESIADVFRAAGAEIRESWCGPCFGQGPDALKKGESAITSFNRNWTNRMGVGGLGYLASPAVVASSALLGYMAPPSELGIEWRAERFV